MKTFDMNARIERGVGFIAALDQSGGSTPHALHEFGYDDSAWNSDEEMFALIHEMRTRIVTSPCFAEGKVIGAILFERTMDASIDGRPSPSALIERGIVPFVKIDRGLQPESNGVQLMKPLRDLDALLARARKLGVFGTKERSVIRHADRTGIADIVEQQFEIGGRVMSHGMMPIIEPEVDIESPDRDLADRMLLDEVLKALEALPHDQRVMVKLSIPAEYGLFDPLVSHPKVLRVLALSGGYSREDACRELTKNRGMIASFSRALLEDLRHQMTSEQFNAALGIAIDQIYAASTRKFPSAQ